MDVFTLAGKITIDIQNALSNIESVITKVQELESILNGTQTTTQDTAQQVSESVEESTNAATTKTGNAMTKWSVMMGNLATQAANKLYGAGKSFFQTGFEYNQNMEKWTASIKTYLGNDLEEATKLVAELQRFAIDTPLSMEEVMNQAVQLLATGSAPDKLIETLGIIGDISKGDMETFSSISRAYWQIMTTGRLLSQDANQLTQAGVPIWQIMTDYFNHIGRDGDTGWTVSKSRDLATAAALQKNPDLAISGDEVFAALRWVTSDGNMYYNAMNNIMETEYGQAQKMMDNYAVSAGAFSKTFFDVFASDTIPALNDILQQLNEWATENPDALNHLSEAFSSFATGGLDLLLSSLQTLLGWWHENSAEFDAMLVLLGGIAIYAGHPAAGTALIAAGAGDAYTEAKKQVEGGSTVGQTLMKESPEVAEAVKNGTTGELGFKDWVNYNIGAPLVQFLHNLFPALTVEPDPYNPSEWVTTDNTLDKWNTRESTFSLPGEDGKGGSNNPFFASLQAVVAQIRSEVSAGAQEGVAAGLSGVTITGTVTTGNVTLDTGAVVGQIAPRMNLVLGGMNAMSGRG